MCTSSETRLEWPGRGNYSGRTQINPRGPKGATIRVTPRTLLKSGLQPLGRYGTPQETISWRPEQMYTPSDIRLEWLREGRDQVQVPSHN